MKLDTGWVELSVDGKPARGYTARPAGRAALPGVIVIQEAFGVDGFVRDVTERLATTGYAAIAPDLYSVGGTPAALAGERVEEAKAFLDTVPAAVWFDAALRSEALAQRVADVRARLEETIAALLPAKRPWDQYLATVGAGHAWLAAGPALGRKVGALGFCMGGALTLRLACRDPELAAAVSFYGASPPPDHLDGLRCPVLAHYAEQDPQINAGVSALAEALRTRGRSFAHHSYAGTRHAFMNDTRANFNAEAKRVAWGRTLGFLAEAL